jgi:hypothetical protein
VRLRASPASIAIWLYCLVAILLSSSGDGHYPTITA